MVAQPTQTELAEQLADHAHGHAHGAHGRAQRAGGCIGRELLHHAGGDDEEACHDDEQPQRRVLASLRGRGAFVSGDVDDGLGLGLRGRNFGGAVAPGKHAHLLGRLAQQRGGQHDGRDERDHADDDTGGVPAVAADPALDDRAHERAQQRRAHADDADDGAVALSEPTVDERRRGDVHPERGGRAVQHAVHVPLPRLGEPSTGQRSQRPRRSSPSEG